MAKVSFILDKRTSDAQGRFPIKLRIVARNSNTSISTKVFIPDVMFVGDPNKVVSPRTPNASVLNMQLHELYLIYIRACMELEKSGRIDTMSAADIRDYVDNQKEFGSERTFTSCLLEYRDNCRTAKTKQGYDYALQMMRRYCNKDKFLFEDITFKFLTDFDRWMEDNGIKISSRSIVFRNMRTVYNYAINNEWVSLDTYPFRKFKIKQGRKEKVYLPVEKMRELLSLDLSGVQGNGVELARDFFVLSFLLCGINPIDLYNLPNQEKQIKFIRQKVAYHEPEPIKISIQPEAEYLISERQGKEHLLNLSEKYLSFNYCYRFMVKSLKKLGDMIGCPDITFYWARYSWATYASKIDVSDSTISKALGHADATLAEKRYEVFEWEKVDRANRRVIDYVLYGKVARPTLYPYSPKSCRRSANLRRQTRISRQSSGSARP